jgi:sulfite exporter TauE/SafE
MRILLSLFILGFSFGLGPCLASCGPILISYVVGNRKGILKSLWTYVLFSSARISVYIILSLAVFLLGKFSLEKLLGTYYRYIVIAGGSFIILLGLLMASGKKIKFRFWQFLEEKMLEHDKKSVIALGMIIGFIPCAPLLAAFSYIGLISKSWLNSLSYSFSFGIGTFLSPLILLTVLSGMMPRFLTHKKGIYSRVFSFICGLIIIFLGAHLISRAF